MTNRLAVVAGIGGLVLLPAVAFGFDHAQSAAMGATLGTLQYLADEDSRADASPRFAFGATFEYSRSARSAIRLDTSLGWVSYPDDKSPVTAGVRDSRPVKQVWPTVFSLIRRFDTEGDNFFYAGAGAGLYWWRFRISGKTQRDPETLERVESGRVFTFDPGVHALLGYERPVSDNVAIQGEAFAHYVFSANDTDRPDKDADSEYADYPVFNGNDVIISGRIGLKLYFDLERVEEPEEEWVDPRRRTDGS